MATEAMLQFEHFAWLSIHSALVLAIGGVSVLLHRCLRRASALRKIYLHRAEQWQTGAPEALPTFEAPQLLGAGRASSVEFLGAPAVLLFFRPDGSESSFGQIVTSAAALSPKVDGAMFLICSGSSSSCRDMAHCLRDLGLSFKAALDDADGVIASLCGIDKTPAAVFVDEKCQIVKRGSLLHSHLSSSSVRSQLE